tara:strand:+ start:5290 stop:5724 length:435 start_codon:yes stop_codon:yes gene_type:complete
MKLTQINKQALKSINADVASALKAVEEKYGISVNIKNAHYTDGTTGDAKLMYSIVSADGNTMTEEATAFKERIQYWDNGNATQKLAAEDLFQKFTCQGKEFKVVGLRTRARKQPILAQEVSSGKEFIFTYESVLRAFISQRASA